MKATPPRATSAATRQAIDSALRALHAAGSESLEAAASAFALHACGLLECECTVSIVDPSSPDTFRVAAGAGAWAQSIVGSAIAISGTLHGSALAERGPVVSDDVQADSSASEVLGPGGITRGLVLPLAAPVPLPDGQPAVGVVGLWRAGGEPFDDLEVMHAREFVEIAGAALARGELLRAYRSRAQHLGETVRELEAARERLGHVHARALEALAAVSRHVDAGGSVADFFGQMSATVAGLVAAERVGFARLTPRGTLRAQLHGFGASDAELRTLGELRIHRDGHRGLERVVNDGLTARLRVADIPPDDVLAPQALRALARRDLAITRWSAGDRTLGILAAYDCRRPGGFTEEDALVLEICARATGLVWEQVRLRRRARTAEAQRVAQVQEHAQRMNSIVSSALDGIVTIDAEGRIVDLNLAAEQLFGHPAATAIGRPIAELMIPPDLREPHLRALRRRRRGGDVLFRRLEAPGLRADGTTFDAEISVVSTTSEGETLYTGFVRDVTELRRVAEREREQAAHVAALEQAKTRLLNLASHELRGPLGVLNGYLAMLEEGALGTLPPDLASVMPLLRSKVTEMNLLVDGMLDAARIDDAHLRLMTTTADLCDIVREAVDQVAGMQSDRERIHLCAPAGPVAVLADPVRLGQLVGNLVHNALKYSPGGEPVDVAVSAEDGRGVVRVEDRGIGIDAADLPRLFTRFGRIVNPRNSHIPGTGLGLYLARELAHLHGGDIEVESSPGRGSVFRLWLPLASSD